MHTLKRDDIELELRFRHRRTDTSSHKYRGRDFRQGILLYTVSSLRLLLLSCYTCISSSKGH